MRKSALLRLGGSRWEWDDCSSMHRSRGLPLNVGRMCILFFSMIFVCSPLFPFGSAQAKDPKNFLSSPSDQGSGTHSDKQLVQLPENPSQEQINAIVAVLSDDQVRLLLLEELKKSSKESTEKEQKAKPDGFAGIIHMVEENASAFHTRLNDLRAGVTAVPTLLPKTIANLQDGERRGNTFPLFATICVLLLGGLGAEWLFDRAVHGIRRQLVSSVPVDWTVKVKWLSLYALTDILGIGVFTITTLTLFFLFFNHGVFSRLILFTYLTVALVLRGILVLARFVLAPQASALRYLPLEDAAASGIYRWLVTISTITGAGLLISLGLELLQVSEEMVVVTDAINGLLLLSIVIYLLLKNRATLKRLICQQNPGSARGSDLLRSKMAAYWHLLAIPYLILIWGVWVFWLLVDQDDLVIPVLALLLSLPCYIVLNFLGQKLLSGIFGLVRAPELPQVKADALELQDAPEGAEQPAATPCPGSLNVHRFVPILRRCLSLSIAGILLFWILRLWGFGMRLETEMAAAALKILLVVSLSYVGWHLIEGAIQRRMEKEGVVGVADDDAEAGGEGGSRIATLLQIFRKVILIVLLVIVGLIILSALGIDTKPILAGAGILGLAVGLGTQSLIKDIVSGMFFLIDDAFRIGDYIEAGKIKGTVEGISVRSLRLRHSRGMVLTIPFSQLGTVTNYSRDYFISKLDFRVPFDTDIDKVRKIIKKIDKEISQDEELAPHLLSPIKSVGVKMFDDSAMIMRLKFKSKPGQNFLIQRQVLKRLQELFEEKGLEFAHRHVIVRLPEDSSSAKSAHAPHSQPTADSPAADILLSAAAAAAITDTLAREDTLKKQQAEEEDGSMIRLPSRTSRPYQNGG